MKGIEPQAREAAKKAARQAGVTLGEWLNRQILQADQATPEKEDESHAPEAPGHEIASRLDALAHRLDRLFESGEEAKAQPPTSGLQATPESSDLRTLAHRVDRQDGAIGTMRGELERIAEKLETGGAAAGTVTALETALYNVVDHIELTDKRNSEVLKTIQSRLSELAGRVGAGSGADAEGHVEALQRLEERIGELAERIERAESNAIPHDHRALEAKLGELANRVDAARREVHDNPAITALESRLNQLTSKLTVTERSITPPGEVKEIRGEVGRLREEVRSATETGKPAMFKAMESRLNTLAGELASVRNGAATESAVDSLSSRVETIQKRVSEAERAASVGPRLDVVEKRVGEIARRLESAPDDSGLHPQIAALESKVGELAERIDRAMRSEATGPALRELESQVGRLADRLSAADKHFHSLDSIEANLSQLFDSIETARDSAVEAAERAARDAASEFLANQAGSSDVGSSEAIAALERGLADVKSRAANADTSNQETLEAIHDTLKRVIDRLNALEAGGSRPPDEPEPSEDLSSLAGEFTPEDVADFRLPPLPEAPRGSQEGDEVGKSHPTATEGDADKGDAFAEAYEAPASNGEKSAPNDDFIAAARRAALAANDTEGAEGEEQNAKSGGAGSLLKGRRRTLLFAAAALFIVAGALSVSGMLGRGDNPDTSRPAAASGDGSSSAEEVPQIIDRAMALFFPGLYARAASPESGEGSASVTVRPDPAAQKTANDKAPPPDDAPPPTKSSARIVPAPSRGSGAAQPDSGPAPAPLTTEATGSATYPPVGESVLTPSGSLEASPRMMVSRALPDDGWQQPKAAKSDGPTLANVFAPTESGTAALPSAATSAPTGAASPDTLETPPPADPLEAAAQAGDALAQFRLAARLTEAAESGADRARAAAWYKKAATQGLAPAQYRLGTLYEKGQGIPTDTKAAAAWYERAAEQGNVKAMHNLAVLLAGGVRGQPDYSRAASWFERAAEYGVTDSQFNLAVLYERGLGVKTDPAAAYKWFAVAARNGDSEAGKRKDDLAARMEPAALAQARAQSNGWQAKTPDRAVNVVAGRSDETASRADPEIARAQALLAVLGYAPGPADGIMGERTHEAITAFQRDRGLAPSGQMTAELLRHLEAAAAG